MRLLLIVALCLLLVACSNREVVTYCPMIGYICPDGMTTGHQGEHCDIRTCMDGTKHFNDFQGKEYTEVADRSTFLAYTQVFDFYEPSGRCTSPQGACNPNAAFSNDNGCGCVYHHAAPTTVITNELAPVCGWYSGAKLCESYPCAKTFGNIGEASLDQDVIYTTPGACADVSKPITTTTGTCPQERLGGCFAYPNIETPTCGYDMQNRTTQRESPCAICSGENIVRWELGHCPANTTPIPDVT